MKKGFFAFVFLFVCNLFTFGVSASDFKFSNNRSPSSFDAFSEFFSGLLTSLPIAVIVIVLLIVVATALKGKRGGSLILEEFNFNENEDEFLKIKGRASGFWNWVLSLSGKAPTTFFTCNKQVLKYEASNIKYNIPLANIACVSSGMLKSSVLLLVLGILFIIAGFFNVRYTFGVLIVGIVLLIVYVLNKKSIYFGIYIGENKPMLTVSMKRGIIGSIDINRFESAASALNKAVLANKS